jgi:hypothetical protein
MLISVEVVRALCNETLRVPVPPVPYGGVLLSTPLHAAVSLLLLNVTLQIANKRGFIKKKNSNKNAQDTEITYNSIIQLDESKI